MLSLAPSLPANSNQETAGSISIRRAKATVFGKKYDANYAPLMGANGKVTGALFVGVAK